MLAHGEYGDPDGLPVVVQAGTPSTGRCGELLHLAALRRGVRLVSVTRPGYGAVAVTPPGLTSVAEQVRQLADDLGLERFGVWGLSGGGPYALAQAVATPDRVTRVVVSAGVGPGLPVQDVTELVTEADELASFFGGLDAHAFVESRPPWEMFFRDHPELADVFIADLRSAVARPDGHVRDNLSWQGDWDFSLGDALPVDLPVDLVYGEMDQMVPLDNGHRLAEAIAHARLHILPGAGHGYATFGSTDLACTLFAG